MRVWIPALLLFSIGFFSVSVAECGLLGLFGCGYETPDEVRDLDRISASTIVEAFKDGGFFCNRPNVEDATCSAVKVLRTVNSDGITVSSIAGVPYSFKAVTSYRLIIRNNMLCRDSSAHIDRMTGYSTSNREARITEFDVIAPIEIQNEAREQLRAVTDHGREYCWSYWRLNEPSEGLTKELVMVTYIDGVLQPFDGTDRAAFFSEDLTLAIRED